MIKATKLYWNILSGIYQGWAALINALGKLILHFNTWPTDQNYDPASNNQLYYHRLFLWIVIHLKLIKVRRLYENLYNGSGR